MKNLNLIPYISPSMEIIALECNDIVSTSDIISPGDNPGNTPGNTPDATSPGGYVADDNFLGKW